MKRIKLTKGEFALVDDEDFEFLSQWKWFCQKFPNGRRVANRVEIINGRQTIVSMYRFLVHAPKGLEVDHKNHDTLDNRRCNLRVCTHAENMRNKKTTKNKWGFKGIYCYIGRRTPWYASIIKDRRRYSLGYFTSAIDAAKAYNKAALELHGDFAYINTI